MTMLLADATIASWNLPISETTRVVPVREDQGGAEFAGILRSVSAMITTVFVQSPQPVDLIK